MIANFDIERFECPHCNNVIFSESEECVYEKDSALKKVEKIIYKQILTCSKCGHKIDKNTEKFFN